MSGKPATIGQRRTSFTSKSVPSKPAGGTILCHTKTALNAIDSPVFDPYYVDSGASSHYINQLAALHDYMPFKASRSIRTAEAGSIHALGLGTLKFTTVINDKQVSAELKDVYYVPSLHTRLISIRKLFAQGLQPCLNQDGISVYNEAKSIIFHTPMRDNIYITMLHTSYPEQSLYVLGTLDEQLQNQLLNPSVAFANQEKVMPLSLYN